MQQSYQIISQNDLERQGDVRNAFITVCYSDSLSFQNVQFAEWLSCFWIRADYQCIDGFQRGMLAQLAARLQARHAAGSTGEDDGVPVVVDDNCAV